ncbi:MAG: hypothetical protein AB8B99_23305 [Phormidesmis sp.]
MEREALTYRLARVKQGLILMEKDSLNSSHQEPSVGFISAPAWFDPSSHDFTTAVQETVITQQTFPLLPDFDYSLDSIASEQLTERFCLCAQSLQAAGCNLIVQVGSPFSWANIKSEAQVRQRQARMIEAANLPIIMTSLAIMDALRAHQVDKIAISSTYYSSSWNKHFSSFISLCGFDVLHASNFYQQGLVEAKNGVGHFKYADYAREKMSDMVKASVQSVKNATPECEAIIIVGTGARTLNILRELEAIAQCPVIPADTAVYWLAAQHLRLTLSPEMGYFRNLSYQQCYRPKFDESIC